MLMVVNHISSKAHADSYQAHLQQHMTILQELFPDLSVQPVHHMALHSDDFLKDLGPSHGYHVPGFERVNYLLQSTTTNQKQGQVTVSSSSIMLMYAG